MYFSRRLIYFIPVQVYFQCNNSLWREDRFLEAPLFAADIHSAEEEQNVLPQHEHLLKLGSDLSSFSHYDEMVSGTRNDP